MTPGNVHVWKVNGRKTCRTCHLMKECSARQQAEKAKQGCPWCLVTWVGPFLSMGEPLFFPSRAAAIAAAPEGKPFTVVNVEKRHRTPIPDGHERNAR